MTLEYFYSAPDINPVKYSDDFLEINKREIFYYQKNFKITYPPFFKIKRHFYLLQSYLTKKFIIGQVTAGLGDMVLYSHLPRLIKILLPDFQVFVYESDISRIVFANNPYIDGFTKERRHLWKKKGSGCEYGSGHFTQMKAQFFGIKTCLAKGELFISLEEKMRASILFPKPVATIQAHGKTIPNPIPDEIWGAIVKELQKRYFVIQLKSPEENTIEGVSKIVTGIRECIVSQSIAKVHVGVDSGFMHTSAALNIPTIVILDRISMKLPLLKNGAHQLVLPQLKGRGLDFLYPQHTYLCVGPSSPKAPPLTQETLNMAVDSKIYPFGNKAIWNLS